ncbi:MULTISPECIES: hypothetical protein [unclassified Yoonia]|uniref:hypothetical protein n=1 Tax=unclassified Yoonia TaxID=2629118 RepID=UPI002B002DB2|nr:MULTISPECIES: hypothetical protein [unclassified Yoonia]
MIFASMKIAALKAALPLFVVTAVSLAGLLLWQSRSSALDDLRAAEDRLATIEQIVQVERQRRLDAEQIAADRRYRDDAVAQVQDACIDTALPSGLWE